MVVGVVLREKKNVWWLCDFLKEFVHGAAGFMMSLIALLLAPVVIPVKIIIDWKTIDKAAVNRYWDRWFYKSAVKANG